jgi:heterodisulfide reductase subunit C
LIVGELNLKPRIMFQEGLDTGFGPEIASRPGGEDLMRCIQCGTCSGTCPVSIYMDYTPRRIMAMTRAGVKDEVLASNTIWLCASCYSCTVDCPKQIKITDIMYLLKQEAIAQGKHTRRLPIPILAREARKSVMQNGRISEGRLATITFLKSDPLKLLGHAGVGIGLFLHGRLPIAEEAMKHGREQVRRLLHAVEDAREGNGNKPETGKEA